MTRRAPRVGSSLRQLLHWALANTLKQKFDLENALVRDKLGGDAGTLPFGSTVVNVREVVPGGAFGRWVPLLLALVAGKAASRDAGGRSAQCRRGRGRAARTCQRSSAPAVCGPHVS